MYTDIVWDQFRQRGIVSMTVTGSRGWSGVGDCGVIVLDWSREYLKLPVGIPCKLYALLTHENLPLYCLYMVFECMCELITVSYYQW